MGALAREVSKVFRLPCQLLCLSQNERVCPLVSEILSFYRRLLFRREMLSRKADMKSQKLSPFINWRKSSKCVNSPWGVILVLFLHQKYDNWKRKSLIFNVCKNSIIPKSYLCDFWLVHIFVALFRQMQAVQRPFLQTLRPQQVLRLLEVYERQAQGRMLSKGPRIWSQKRLCTNALMYWYVPVWRQSAR